MFSLIQICLSGVKLKKILRSITEKLNTKNLIKILEWSASLLIIVGSYLNAHDLGYDKQFFIIANLLWIAVGIFWRKPSIVMMSLTMLSMYMGII